MIESQISHRNKVKLMGTFLIIASILSALFMIGCLLVTGLGYKALGEKVNFDETFSFDFEEKEKKLLELEQKSRDLGSDELAKTVEEARKQLEEAKREVAQPEVKEALEEMPKGELNLKRLFFSLLFGTVLTVLMCIFLIMIGRSWRAVDPFSRRVIVGLRGLGIMFLVQLVFNLLVPDPEMNEVFEILNAYPFYNFSMAPLLIIGLLLLTLSWVVEHGRELDENEKLTI